MVIMIDTNTLMTGDLVTGHIPGIPPMRITQILDSFRVAGDINGTYIELSIDNIMPIPVTNEILANNGWKLRNGFMIYDSGEPKCRFGWRNGSFILGYAAYPIPVHDVHHLQNIMRNAGLRDYANNFQIFI